MKIETLKERIKKTEENIEKSTATLGRHNTQLAKKAKAITDKGINLKSYDKFDRSKVDHDTYWDICDYEHKLEDIENTEKKIAEYKKTLEGLKKQLKDQLAKDKEAEAAIPEVLNQFLEAWKQKAMDYYIRLSSDYLKLLSKKAESYEITAEELAKLTSRRYNAETHKYEMRPDYTKEQTERILYGTIRDYDRHNIQYNIRQRHIKDFINSRFASDMAVVFKIAEGEKLNKKALEKILDEEVRIKKQQFIARVKEVIGEIKDLSGLKIRGKGEINGIAKGVKCNAKVETITAGGYNIQCFHYRILVNTVK